MRLFTLGSLDLVGCLGWPLLVDEATWSPGNSPLSSIESCLFRRELRAACCCFCLVFGFSDCIPTD